MSLATFLDDTVTVKLATMTADAEGGFVQSLSAGTAFSAYVRDTRAANVEVHDKEGSVATHTIYFATDPGANMADVIVFGSRSFVVLGKADRLVAVSGFAGEEYFSLLCEERA